VPRRFTPRAGRASASGAPDVAVIRSEIGLTLGLSRGTLAGLGLATDRIAFSCVSHRKLKLFSRRDEIKKKKGKKRGRKKKRARGSGEQNRAGRKRKDGGSLMVVGGREGGRDPLRCVPGYRRVIWTGTIALWISNLPREYAILIVPGDRRRTPPGTPLFPSPPRPVLLAPRNRSSVIFS